jgi:hypothetical protein
MKLWVFSDLHLDANGAIAWCCLSRARSTMPR